MKIIGATRAFLCDESFSILHNGAVAIVGSKIAKVADFNELCAIYPNAESTFFHDAVLLPGLINAHTHFEFSANVTELTYGSFGRWLDSVIKKRESIMSEAQEAMSAALDEILKSGTTSVGAISSGALDLEILASSPLRVVFFNEIIGSNPAVIDVLWSDFCGRVEASKEYASARFTPTIALHSPYSLHKELALRAIKLAKELDAPLSAHFLESKEERRWLEESSGFFAEFFARFFNQTSLKAQYSPREFLEILPKDSILIHGVEMGKSELRLAKELGFSLVSCPRSNRLLGGKMLDLDAVKAEKIPLSFATDGNSSNFSLSLLDEIRIALFAYTGEDLEELARTLLLGITRTPAKALKLNCGALEVGKEADLAVFNVKKIEESSQEVLQFILHAKEAQALYIAAQKVL